MRSLFIFIYFQICSLTYVAQNYTKADSLKGSLNAERTWWDVTHYQLNVKLDITNKSINGYNTIKFKTLFAGKKMQIDLQTPLKIDSVLYHKTYCKWNNSGNVWVIELPVYLDAKLQDSIRIYYSGIPRPAKFAPWDGGISWKKDDKNRPWIGVSCQGLGASVWWPNKDHQSDEPDNGMQISVNIPDTLVNISNGKLISFNKNPDKTITWNYQVKNPINNYDVTMNIGKYITVKDSFIGQNGILPIEYVVLDYHQNLIESHLVKDTKDMLRCFEYWFGPYPFYEDGYRLVETSYLGMEHQSAIAYGNKFKKGYLGRDRSESGVGMLWDFIIIHESGHEWFGNNITCADNADMWIHEGFTTYSEVLFIECNYNKDSANKYIKGLRKNILNDKPMIGDYNVNNEGSGDIYDKGANLIHTIRQIIDNDSVFRSLLLGLNKEFGKKTVSTKEIETYIIKHSGKDLSPVFDQYLRNKSVPQFEFRLKNNKLSYKWTNCLKGFNMPVKIYTNNNELLWLYPTSVMKDIQLKKNTRSFFVDQNFYIHLKNRKTK